MKAEDFKMSGFDAEYFRTAVLTERLSDLCLANNAVTIDARELASGLAELACQAIEDSCHKLEVMRSHDTVEATLEWRKQSFEETLEVASVDPEEVP